MDSLRRLTRDPRDYRDCVRPAKGGRMPRFHTLWGPAFTTTDLPAEQIHKKGLDEVRASKWKWARFGVSSANREGR